MTSGDGLSHFAPFLGRVPFLRLASISSKLGFWKRSCSLDDIDKFIFYEFPFLVAGILIGR